MQKLTINNTMIDFVPKLPVMSQKFLYYIVQKIIEEKKYSELNWFEIFFQKADFYNLLDSEKNQRANLYKYIEPIVKPIHIDTEDDHYYTSIVSWINEKKRTEQVIINVNSFISRIIARKWHYFLLDFLIFSKLEKKISILIYQYITRYKNIGNVAITSQEINALLKTNYVPTDIYKLLKIAQKEIWTKTDLDFTIEKEKLNKKIIFQIKIIHKDKFLIENSKEMKDFVLENYKKIIENKDIIELTQFINRLNEYQTDLLYDILKNKRTETDKNIMIKIEGIMIWGRKNTNYYKTICQVIMYVDYSKISKTIDKCAVEVQKWKLNDKIAFVLSRLKQLIN